MPWIDPYHRLGLRCNPFVTEPAPGVAEALWLDRGFSQAPPIQAQFLLQIIGEKGAGKTSHLLHWQQQTGGGYTYYPLEVMQRWRIPAFGAIAYWDEVDRMPTPLLLSGLMFAKQQRSTIVAGTHECLEWAAKQVGLRVQTIVLPQFTPEELLQWATQRIATVRLREEQEVSLKLTLEDANRVVQQSDRSWRQAATILHIWAAETALQRSDRSF